MYGRKVVHLRVAARQPCEAGTQRCGEPGRLYPCGWRCDGHSPKAVRERTEARAAVEPAVQGLAA